MVRSLEPIMDLDGGDPDLYQEKLILAEQARDAVEALDQKKSLADLKIEPETPEQRALRIKDAIKPYTLVKADPYFTRKDVALYKGDSFELLKNMKPHCVDVIFADPPYFLSNGGITCQSGQMVRVDKGDWDQDGESIAKKHSFNRKWIKLCYRVLKDQGTIWISGTYHNIYSIGMALEQEGFKILNNITWQKNNPPPNLACKCFTHSTETILWAKKDNNERHYFNYALMKKLNGDKQMKDVWRGSLTPPAEKKFGKHPTQKPKYILENIIDASTQESDVVLDPFCGSSTTGVVALEKCRKYIGFDNEIKFIELSKNRIQDVIGYD